MTKLTREAVAEALNPDVFNVNHPGYSGLGYCIARQVALERADRVMPLLAAVRKEIADEISVVDDWVLDVKYPSYVEVQMSKDTYRELKESS